MKITDIFKNRFGFKQTPKIEYKSFGGSSFADMVLGGGGRVSPTKVAQLYRESSAISTAVDMIAKEIEAIKPVVMLDDGSFTSDHPVIELLNNPNEFEDYREFIGQVARNFILNHDAFIYIEGSLNNPPANLFCAKNQLVDLRINQSDKYPDSYQIQQSVAGGSFTREKRKKSMRFINGNLREIYHIHGYSSSSDNGMADSPIQSILNEAQAMIKGVVHNLNVIDNGGRLSMVAYIKTREPMPAEEFEEAERRIVKKLGGANNAGKIAVANFPDMELKEMGQSNKDMDFNNLLQISKQAVYSRFFIPLPMIDSDRQTLNNYSTGIEAFYNQAVLPYYSVIMSGLTKCLKTRYRDSFNKITYNKSDIDALRLKMLEELKARRDLNLETINELRGLLPNRDPIEGGDTHYQPANLIPSGQDLIGEPMPEEAESVKDAFGRG